MLLRAGRNRMAIGSSWLRGKKSYLSTTLQACHSNQAIWSSPGFERAASVAAQRLHRYSQLARDIVTSHSAESTNPTLDRPFLTRSNSFLCHKPGKIDPRISNRKRRPDVETSCALVAYPPSTRCFPISEFWRHVRQCIRSLPGTCLCCLSYAYIYIAQVSSFYIIIFSGPVSPKMLGQRRFTKVSLSLWVHFLAQLPAALSLMVRNQPISTLPTIVLPTNSVDPNPALNFSSTVSLKAGLRRPHVRVECDDDPFSVDAADCRRAWRYLPHPNDHSYSLGNRTSNKIWDVPLPMRYIGRK